MPIILPKSIGNTLLIATSGTTAGSNAPMEQKDLLRLTASINTDRETREAIGSSRNIEIQQTGNKATTINGKPLPKSLEEIFSQVPERAVQQAAAQGNQATLLASAPKAKAGEPQGIARHGNHCWAISLYQMIHNSEALNRELSPHILRDGLAGEPRQSTELEKVFKLGDGLDDKKEHDPIDALNQLLKKDPTKFRNPTVSVSKSTGKKTPSQDIYSSENSIITQLIPNSKSKEISFKELFSQSMENPEIRIDSYDMSIDAREASLTKYTESPDNIIFAIGGGNEENKKNAPKIKDIPLTHDFVDHTENRTSAVLDLKSFIVHQGSTTESGHYITYVKKEDNWFKCNDDKVEKQTDVQIKEALEDAYILHYEKSPKAEALIQAEFDNLNAVKDKYKLAITTTGHKKVREDLLKADQLIALKESIKNPVKATTDSEAVTLNNCSIILRQMTLISTYEKLNKHPLNKTTDDIEAAKKELMGVTSPGKASIPGLIKNLKELNKTYPEAAKMLVNFMLSDIPGIKDAFLSKESRLSHWMNSFRGKEDLTELNLDILEKALNKSLISSVKSKLAFINGQINSPAPHNAAKTAAINELREEIFPTILSLLSKKSTEEEKLEAQNLYLEAFQKELTHRVSGLNKTMGPREITIRLNLAKEEIAAYAKNNAPLNLDKLKTDLEKVSKTVKDSLPT